MSGSKALRSLTFGLYSENVDISVSRETILFCGHSGNVVREVKLWVSSYALVTSKRVWIRCTAKPQSLASASWNVPFRSRDGA